MGIATIAKTKETIMTSLNIIKAREEDPKFQQLLKDAQSEGMHPDAYRIREAVRQSILGALDNTALKFNMKTVDDGDLIEVFRFTDEMAHRMWLRRVGLMDGGANA
jgi:hypothetical protein